MIRAFILAGALAMTAATAWAEEPIVGNWKTESGDTAVIGSCARGYCVTLKTGKFAGRDIGWMQGKDGAYTGELTDPAAEKTYSGSAKTSGDSIQMQGCVLKIFCKSQTWKRI